MSPVAAQLESVADRAFHSPWPPPAVPDVDLTSFALRDAPRLAGRPALIDAASGRTLRYGELAAGGARAAGGQLRNTRARMLITAGPLAAVGAEAAAQAGVEDLLVLGEAPGLTPFAELLASEDAPPEIELHPDDVALMLSSGGTTGLPKVVQLTHRALVANLRQMAGPYPIGEGEPVLGLAPFFHSMGLVCVLHHALASGGTVVCVARLELEGTLGALETHRVSHALVAPPVLALLAHHPLVDSFDLSALRTLGSGGAPASAALERAVADRLAASSARG